MLASFPPYVRVSGRRYLAAVKELPWCAPKDSPTRRKRRSNVDSHLPSTKKNNNEKDGVDDGQLTPVDKFGIVAAISRNNVIGVNGVLPWNLPEDRKWFKALTENKVLILGRKTFQEDERLRHIKHARSTIVVSRSMTQEESGSIPNLLVARSFPEALHLARDLVPEARTTVYDETSIDCWVAGGERIYHEALLHPSAQALHLTRVHVEIGLDGMNEYARFPTKARWDHKFKRESVGETEIAANGLEYTHEVYVRL